MFCNIYLYDSCKNQTTTNNGECKKCMSVAFIYKDKTKSENKNIVNTKLLDCRKISRKLIIF